MNGPWTMESAAVYRARVRGCLLGGALGDALGYPIEFSSLDRIRATHGEYGVTGSVFDKVGLISDDTQMTLFTAEALTQACARERERGVSGGWSRLLSWAYERWLETQTKPGPEHATHAEGSPRGSLMDEAWLYSRRAPGNACLSGVAQNHHPEPWLELDGKPGQVNPASKGCGTVMRSAPFGLCHDDVRAAFEMAARAAQITHGHPTGYYAAGALAAIVAALVTGESLEGAVLRAMRLLARYPGHEETTTALGRAVELAAQGDPTPEKVETLGPGWVAEEALAIAVYSALAFPRSVRHAVLLSVNHSGDSDSTGSICGNLVGARHGDVGLPQEWVERVEGRATIARVADDLAGEIVRL